MNKILTALIIICFLFSPLRAEDKNFWKISYVNQQWWFQSPSGNLDFINSVQSVRPEQNGILEKYTSKHSDNWAYHTVEEIKNTGFKAIGAWSDERVGQYYPYFKDLNLSKWTKKNIDDKDWEKDIEEAVKLQVKPDDINLIGYYTDNEMDWKHNENNANKYFEIVHRLIKQYDPNHLILGVRFNARPSKLVLMASVGKVDAHSVNQYAGVNINMLKEINAICNVPIIISEFSFFSDEGMSGNKNINWPGGGRVANRQERARKYKEFVHNLAECSFIIGADWFQWNDEPPSGRTSDKEDLNCGIVSIHDKQYPEMVAAVQDISNTINHIHKSSTTKQSGAAWVEDYDRDPK